MRNGEKGLNYRCGVQLDWLAVLFDVKPRETPATAFLAPTG